MLLWRVTSQKHWTVPKPATISSDMRDNLSQAKTNTVCHFRNSKIEVQPQYAYGGTTHTDFVLESHSTESPASFSLNCQTYSRILNQFLAFFLPGSYFNAMPCNKHQDKFKILKHEVDGLRCNHHCKSQFSFTAEVL